MLLTKLKIAKSIGLIYKASFYLHHNFLLLLYYALICPYLTCTLIYYGLLLMSQIYKEFTSCRPIDFKVSYRAPSKPLFTK